MFYILVQVRHSALLLASVHTFLRLRQLSSPNHHPYFLRCSTFFRPLLNLSHLKSTRFQFSFGFRPMYIQIPLFIHNPFCTDTALHITPQPLFTLLGFVTRFLTRSYIAISRLRFYTDIGSTFPWKWRHQQWLTRRTFSLSFGI